MSSLRQLKLRITDYFLNEENLMKDITQSGLIKIRSINYKIS
jgi:hypothetical protein